MGEEGQEEGQRGRGGFFCMHWSGICHCLFLYTLYMLLVLLVCAA